MNLASIDIILLFLYVLALLFMGVGFAARSMDDENYMLAARKLTLPAFVMSLVTTWYGLIFGVGEFVYLSGIVAWVVNGLFWYIVYFVFAFLLAKKIHESRALTVADHFRSRLGKKSASFASVMTYIMTTPAPYVLSLGVFLSQIFSWNLYVAVILSLFVSAVYVWWGGFNAVVRTDKFQFVFMFLGFGLLLGFSFAEFGGLEFLRQNLPDHHLTFKGDLGWQSIFVWGMLAFWTLVDPNFYQRCYAAKSSKIAQKGVLWSIVFWVIFDLMTLTAGLYARAAFPEINPVDAYLVLADGVLPVFLKGIFLVTILSIIMSTIDSFLFSSSTIIANDFLKGRVKGSMKKMTRWGILITLIASFILILIFESIIGIVYAVGTVGVASMLIPILFLLFSKKKMSDSAVLFSMISSALISGYWMVDGWMKQEYGWPNYLLGIEPMYVGLVFSLLMMAGIYASCTRESV